MYTCACVFFWRESPQLLSGSQKKFKIIPKSENFWNPKIILDFGFRSGLFLLQKQTLVSTQLILF